MPDQLNRLPEPQRDALRTVFGLSQSAVPDRFFVGLAVFGLLSEVSEHGPLVCAIDDARCLDRPSAQVLAFVARRLLVESVVILFAARERSDALRGLRELVVEGLPQTNARELSRCVECDKGWWAEGGESSLKFLLELMAIAAFAYWGASHSPVVLAVILAIAIPAVFAPGRLPHVFIGGPYLAIGTSVCCGGTGQQNHRMRKSEPNGSRVPK